MMQTNTDLQAAACAADVPKLVPAFEHVDAYFDRIGYRGTARPERGVLETLHRLHPQAIAFENLSPFCGEPVSLEPDALYRKLVVGRRGGYCYEHNLLFAGVLTAIGFRVSGLAARVLLGASPGSTPVRGHMLLRIDLDERVWLADVGFGGLTLTSPLDLGSTIRQKTSHEDFVISPCSKTYQLYGVVAGEQRLLYEFDLQPQQRCDYEVMNWYQSSHPSSRFISGLMLARVAPTGRHALSNGRYRFYDPRGGTRTRQLRHPDELLAVLDEDFGLDTRTLPGLKSRCAALLENEAAAAE